MLLQLIQVTREQLEESNACIEWYQVQSEKYEKRLDELQKLVELAKKEAAEK